MSKYYFDPSSDSNDDWSLQLSEVPEEEDILVALLVTAL